ncbi:MAG: cyanophycin synthetase [Candidatus Peribacteraceae bacterium]|jgi:UDP-N-acetylmuramate--alanine ligase|nr:cyanophycin synthetase [Candidatus Peribacteraceae bacterium]MDP7645969.1 cyanophycin synthetase [Candidatus Peribacteraceae bacterium]
MKIYCSGIGGIGLSAYAAMQNANGHEVLGSDRAESELLNDLRSQGISISLNQDGTYIPEDVELFVFTEAMPKDAPEMVRARELGVKMQNYFEALGDLSLGFKVIAVCGTHGKSSTVAMAARVLIDAGVDPSVVVGTKLKELDGRNWRKGNSDYFLLEACEYRGSFLSLSPDIVLMTNADGDHFDAFESVKAYQETFVEFLKKLTGDGIVITHMKDPDCVRVIRDAKKEVMDIDSVPLPELGVPGKHMRENAQLVIGMSQIIGIDEDQVLNSLKEYSGCWRRMEIVGTYKDDVIIIDDYAHHPKEISATIQSALEAYPDKRILCVFQPHTHDRTLKLYEEFKTCFKGVHELVITDVYDARSDVEKEKVDIEKFRADVEEGSGVRTRYAGSLDATEIVLKNEVVQNGDVIIFLGAGDITVMARRIVTSHKSQDLSQVIRHKS